jgi:hypothetical protein
MRYAYGRMAGSSVSTSETSQLSKNDVFGVLLWLWLALVTYSLRISYYETEVFLLLGSRPELDVERYPTFFVRYR